jgi:hypothetical protein
MIFLNNSASTIFFYIVMAFSNYYLLVTAVLILEWNSNYALLVLISLYSASISWSAAFIPALRAKHSVSSIYVSSEDFYLCLPKVFLSFLVAAEALIISLLYAFLDGDIAKKSVLLLLVGFYTSSLTTL